MTELPPLQVLHDRADTWWRHWQQRLRKQLASTQIPDGPQFGTRPLANVNPDRDEDWLIALTDAWALAGFVLQFHADRIADESYLGSARDPASIVEILRLIDTAPPPGLADSTWLSFRVDATPPGGRSGYVIARGTTIESKPAGAEPVQMWTTTQDCEGHFAWNRFAPPPALQRAEDIAADDGRLLLLDDARAATLAVGTLLVLHARQDVADWSGQHAIFRVVAVAPAQPLTQSVAVKLDRARGCAHQNLVSVSRLGIAARSFGWDAQDWSDLDAAQQLQFGTELGGLLMFDAGRWQACSRGLSRADIRVIAALHDGATLVATDDGIYRSYPAADGSAWQRVLLTQPDQPVLCLTVDASDQVLAGSTSQGVLRSIGGARWSALRARSARAIGERRGYQRARADLNDTPVRSLLRCGQRVLAGTDDGVWCFDERGAWFPSSVGLPEYSSPTGTAQISVLALRHGFGPDDIILGGSRGCWASADAGRTWYPFLQGLARRGADDDRVVVRDLLIPVTPPGSQELMFAVRADGVSRWTADVGHWEAVDHGLPRDPGTDTVTAGPRQIMQALSVPAAELWLATDAGLYVSHDHGLYWDAPAEHLLERPVSTLGRDAVGAPLCAVARGGVRETDWPGIELTGTQVTLDRVEANIAPGAWLTRELIDQPQAAGSLPLTRVRLATTIAHTAFGRSGAATRMQLTAPIPTPRRPLTVRDVRYYVSDVELSLARQTLPVSAPMEPSGLDLDADQQATLGTGRNLAVRGRLMRALLRDHDAVRALDTTTPLSPTPASFRVHTLRALGDGDVACTIITDDGQRQRLDTHVSNLAWLPALPDDEQCVEFTTIVPGESAARGVFGPPLARTFDATSVEIFGNNVPARQGRTITEILGSTAQHEQHPRFTLDVAPLVWVQDAAAGGRRPLLEIEVDEVLWTQVDRLDSAGPKDEVYIVRPESGGHATVIFGDGTRGARLPRGPEHVRARYQVGIWPEPVYPDHLNVLRSRDRGIVAVSNSAITAGGTPRHDATDNPLICVRADPQRVISVRDHAHYFARYPEVLDATARRVRQARGACIVVSLAFRPRTSDDMRQGTIAAASSGLHNVRAGREPVHVREARSVALQFDVAIQIAPHVSADTVSQRVRNVVSEHPAFRRFSAMPTRSDIEARINEVAGVTGPSRVRIVALAQPAPAEAATRRPAAARSTRLDAEDWFTCTAQDIRVAISAEPRA